MQIDFYEEFPTEENLKRLKSLKYPLRLFLASNSLKDFKGLERKVKKIKKDVEIDYWPIIRNSYWISPFSNTQDLERLFHQLEDIDCPLLIDLELPKNRKLIRKNLPYFFRNKKIIRTLIEQNKERITTAEFPVPAISLFMRIMGLDYNIKVQKSLMWYSSMNPQWINQYLKRNLKRLKEKENYSISLGTIAVGILGNEPILSPRNLEKDLEFIKQAEFRKVIMFRLGGLNKDYIKVIEKFLD